MKRIIPALFILLSCNSQDLSSSNKYDEFLKRYDAFADSVNYFGETKIKYEDVHERATAFQKEADELKKTDKPTIEQLERIGRNSKTIYERMKSGR